MNINTDCHLLPMEGAYNIRDLGGYPAENGGVTRKGLFFRADNTANLTPKDVDLLREKGVSLSIDAGLALQAEGMRGNALREHCDAG